MMQNQHKSASGAPFPPFDGGAGHTHTHTRTRTQVVGELDNSYLGFNALFLIFYVFIAIVTGSVGDISSTQNVSPTAIDTVARDSTKKRFSAHGCKTSGMQLSLPSSVNSSNGRLSKTHMISNLFACESPSSRPSSQQHSSCGSVSIPALCPGTLKD